MEKDNIELELEKAKDFMEDFMWLLQKYHADFMVEETGVPFDIWFNKEDFGVSVNYIGEDLDSSNIYH